VKPASSKRPTGDPESAKSQLLSGDYFRVRDFEYVQPLYDLAFLLEVDALANGTEVPKYRTFSLWRAAHSLDGYGTTVERWLDGIAGDQDLDYVPSPRIRTYLTSIRRTGSVPELRSYRSERFLRCLRLRSVRGLGPRKIALTIASRSLDEEWFSQTALGLNLDRDRILEVYEGSKSGPWQAAHIVPPLLRFLDVVQEYYPTAIRWNVSGISDPFEPVNRQVTVIANITPASARKAINNALRKQKHFSRAPQSDGLGVGIRHQMGWNFVIQSSSEETETTDILSLIAELDPLASNSTNRLLSDLHLHTAWSDGTASVNSMAAAAVVSGLKYFAVTDHSRTSKLQGGLTPPLWLRQANALSLATPVCPILHGIEVDILRDGSLDLPHSLLAAADLVVASVHSNWASDARVNTDRLLTAIESGFIDILAHPTSAIVGKPGVPDYVRAAADVHWEEVFEKCAAWGVALELNCFPSRLDLPLKMLKKAINAGCAISVGSDAHARSHLLNLRLGEAALYRLRPTVVLNRFSYTELRDWVAKQRVKRRGLAKRTSSSIQTHFQFEGTNSRSTLLRAQIQRPQNIPDGSRVVGVDLTAGTKATAVAFLEDHTVETCSLVSDSEILAYISTKKAKLVSIDSPLGFPGGRHAIDLKAGIVRVAEYDLASIGIPAYPALIDSMKNLTLRGTRLRRKIEQLPQSPRVIESYPGAAQDILCLPRKQRSLELLREGLRRLGLEGRGLETRSHDEMDAITSAIVGRYFESGSFEPMGIPSEAQLIVPKVRPLLFESNPVICLAGKTGAGKSVIARYLSVFYGFEWIRTRDIIRDLLIDDIHAPSEKKMLRRPVNPDTISEMDLREFGAIVLDLYRQAPLRLRLTNAIKQRDVPVVVDSIRDTVDIDVCGLDSRPLLIWFVDCNDSLIQHRLTARTKLGERRLQTPSPADHVVPSIRREATRIIFNNGSLEELRWRVDDALFASMDLSDR
jgi:histidinol phosphatase-like PHP family hydrolase/predicted nuclease with RNAse H fold/dephospho-CoA kinase